MSGADQPDQTAIRVALWRALHLTVDGPPPIVDDAVGLAIAAPEPGWEQRPDMHPIGTARYRAGIVARARLIEDLVIDEVGRGTRQYVILGAGLDTFAQRRPEIASRLAIFEVDRPGASRWKAKRLVDLGYGVPPHLHLVPVDFEAGASWSREIERVGFDPTRPAVVVSTGVTMYLTPEANAATFREVAALARGTVFATTFVLPLDQQEPAERPGLEHVMRSAAAAGTPFHSLYSAEQMVALARESGFASAEPVPVAEIERRYFAGRSDGLRAATGEQMVIARV